MFRSLFFRKFAFPARFLASSGIALLCCTLLGGLLVACGSNTNPAQQSSTGRYGGVLPTATSLPTPTPTLAPTATPIPTPTPRPPTPTPVPQGAPAVLDLRPASMSFVGHLDCQGKSAYVCTAEVISGSSNQSNLHWRAYTNIPGHIVFSPVSGVLAPGASILIHITIPFNDCTRGLFFFQGPINTHTITWAC